MARALLLERRAPFRILSGLAYAGLFLSFLLPDRAADAAVAGKTGTKTLRHHISGGVGECGGRPAIEVPKSEPPA